MDEWGGVAGLTVIIIPVSVQIGLNWLLLTGTELGNISSNWTYLELSTGTELGNNLNVSTENVWDENIPLCFYHPVIQIPAGVFNKKPLVLVLRPLLSDLSYQPSAADGLTYDPLL